MPASETLTDAQFQAMWQVNPGQFQILWYDPEAQALSYIRNQGGQVIRGLVSYTTNSLVASFSAPFSFASGATVSIGLLSPPTGYRWILWGVFALVMCATGTSITTTEVDVILNSPQTTVGGVGTTPILKLLADTTPRTIGAGSALVEFAGVSAAGSTSTGWSVVPGVVVSLGQPVDVYAGSQIFVQATGLGYTAGTETGYMLLYPIARQVSL